MVCYSCEKLNLPNRPPIAGRCASCGGNFCKEHFDGSSCWYCNGSLQAMLNHLNRLVAWKTTRWQFENQELGLVQWQEQELKRKRLEAARAQWQKQELKRKRLEAGKKYRQEASARHKKILQECEAEIRASKTRARKTEVLVVSSMLLIAALLMLVFGNYFFLGVGAFGLCATFLSASAARKRNLQNAIVARYKLDNPEIYSYHFDNMRTSQTHTEPYPDQ